MFIVTSILILFLTGCVFYFPSHVTAMSKRVMYYLLGNESAEIGLSESVSRLVLGWNDTIAATATGAKEGVERVVGEL